MSKKAEIDKWIEENQGKYLCQCGCDLPITILRRHYHGGIPRYIIDHYGKYVIRGENNPAKRPDVRNIISKARKGKGLGKLSKEHKNKIRLTTQGKPKSAQHNKNVSLAKLKNPELGKKEVKLNVISFFKEGKYGIYELANKYNCRPETVKKILLEILSDEEIKKRVKKSRGIAVEKRWKDPEYKDRMIKATLKGLCKRPTSLEQIFIDLIKEYRLSYKYVGDGQFILGGKCPDFINMNGLKVCIELRPKEMCKIWNECTPEEYVAQRVSHFAKYGWDCLVIWEEDLNNQDIVDFLK